ncbi:HAD family hydrolase [Kitasatospora griseola]|uniref:HAD family hydrolase n=1 Tax=Kitasatospora griseola TaxID=2064 RepID=UPI0038232B90
MNNAPSDATPFIPTHVVWDWNGTLKDDLDDHVNALNATLRALGGPMVDRETYRAELTGPSRAFYNRLLGREVTEQEWTAGNAAFLAHLRAQPVRLRDGAVDMLTALHEAGLTQSLLAQCPSDTVMREAADAGVARFFTRIDGHTALSDDAVVSPLTAHLEALGLIGRGHRVLLIGDTVADADAAFTNRLFTVIFSGGHQHPDWPANAGFPVVDSLADAVGLGSWLVHYRHFP